MPNPARTFVNHNSPVEQRPVVDGYISTAKPAPTKRTEGAWVIVPEHSTTVPIGPCQWAQIHGTALPEKGALCQVAFGEQEMASSGPRIVWWAAGPTGNGTTDDTVAIQAQITTAGEGGAVVLPPGEYLVSKALSIPYSHFTFAGSGYRSTTLKLKNSANSSVITTPDDKVQRAGLLLKDFGIEANAANQAGEEAAIRIRGMNEARLEGLYILEPRGSAIQIGQATGGIFNTVPMITRCVIRGDKVNSQAHGIALEAGSSDAQVIGCDIGFFKLGSGILISGHNGFELIGNQCWQNQTGYFLFAGNRGRLVGNLSDLAQHQGFVLQNVTDTQVIGCQSRESSQAVAKTYDAFFVEGTNLANKCFNLIFDGCRAMGEGKTRNGLRLDKHISTVEIVGCNFTGNEGGISEGTEEVENISGGVWKLLSGLTYKNLWEDFEAARKGEYRKNSAGNVELRGIIKTGASGKEAFTLPEGFRPKQALSPVVEDSAGVAGLLIESNGVVKPTNITGEVKTFCYLNANFSTE